MGCHSDYKYLPLALLLAIYQFSESDRQLITDCECCYLFMLGGGRGKVKEG